MSSPVKTKWPISGTTLGFLLILAVPALLAMPLSERGQAGHITAYNAFLAPFYGPWSLVLPPNPRDVSRWPQGWWWFTVFLMVFLAIMLSASYVRNPVILRRMVKGVTAMLLAAWAAIGIIKVINEMS